MAKPVFIELPAADLAAARAFYASVFGWSLTDFGPSYSCTMTGEVDVGLQGDAAEAPAAPLPVIEVDDLATVRAAILAAGGRITREAFNFPGGSRFHFLDPNGNELAAFRPG